MMSGKCLSCGAEWSSKCVKCRNVFWDEQTQAQRDCRHTQNVTTSKPDKCPYSGCDYDTLPTQFQGK